MVIVDSSVWIDYIRNTRNWQTDWLSQQIEDSDIGLIDLILCEVLQGIPTDTEFDRIYKGFKKFQILPCGGEELAVEAARNYRLLRSAGVTVRKSVDCMIATFCIMGGHTLLHRDRDFEGFENHLGLSVIQPSLQ
jgi:predicted nucleic acid-binding protein